MYLPFSLSRYTPIIEVGNEFDFFVGNQKDEQLEKAKEVLNNDKRIGALKK